jgi:tetratricopeptide (TPR) repeat protein
MRTAREFLGFLTAFAAAFMIASCAVAPVEVEEKRPMVASVMPVEEQEEKSVEAYTDILEMTANVDKLTIVPQLKEKYLELIEDYPDAYFAEESFLRLIELSFRYYDEPNVDAAEHYYMEYFRKYPKPRLDKMMNDTMARSYYRFGFWGRLATFLEPHMMKYARTGKLRGPLYIFFYSEAKFHLQEHAEARKGYQTVIRLFPGSREAAISKERLNKIK